MGKIPNIAVTIDVEWVPGEILEEMLGLLSNKKIPATLFCTDEPRLKTNPLHEYALHPNFFGLNDWELKFESLLKQYPQAKGVRSHCLHSDTRLGRLLADKKVIYQSNLFVPGQPVLPFLRETGVWEVPIHYMDFVHLCTTKNYPKGYSMASIPRYDWVVVDFHPVPWFINAGSIQDYDAAKPFYKDVAKLKTLKRKGEGVATLFQSLIDEISSGKWQALTVTRLVQDFQKASPQA